MGNSRIYRKRRSGWYPDRRSTPRLLERDPSKTDDGIPGSDPVLWKNLCMAAGRDLGELSGTYRRMAGGKVGHLAGEYLVSGVPETMLSLAFVFAALGGSHHVQARGRLAQTSWGDRGWLGGILLLLAGKPLGTVTGGQQPEPAAFDWMLSVKNAGKYVA